jgi:hypothetical protein
LIGKIMGVQHYQNLSFFIFFISWESNVSEPKYIYDIYVYVYI